MHASSGNKPTLRLVRHLARTGGTVISKCLGSMDAVMLLSETHPEATDRWTNLLGQAQHWHGLTTPQEAKGWAKRKLSYADVIAQLNLRAEARGKRLLLREWTHLDYAGVPFAPPTMEPMATRALEGGFSLRVVDTVRHPIDHWLSIQKIETMRALTLDAHLAACAAYARETGDIATRMTDPRAHKLVKYEDFCADPADALRAMCEALDLDYDETWDSKWADNRHVTGDTADSRGNRQRAIAPLTPRERPDGLLEACLANPDYMSACAAWGYDPEG